MCGGNFKLIGHMTSSVLCRDSTYRPRDIVQDNDVASYISHQQLSWPGIMGPFNLIPNQATLSVLEDFLNPSGPSAFSDTPIFNCQKNKKFHISSFHMWLQFNPQLGHIESTEGDSYFYWQKIHMLLTLHIYIQGQRNNRCQVNLANLCYSQKLNPTSSNRSTLGILYCG